jgi:putative transposase
MSLTRMSNKERQDALARYHLLEPYLDGRATLKSIVETHGLSRRTAQRWVKRYREDGLAGLVRRPRSDRGQRRIEGELLQLIESLALQKTRPSSAAIQRQIAPIAVQHGWSVPSYECINQIVQALDPDLVLLAHEGSRAYQQVYDLLYRREASAPNEIWQADHTCMNIWLVTEDGDTTRPWLTVIEDDYSRCIAAYGIWLEHPNTLNTCLTLRQAIWRKSDPRWIICGIPAIFYTDHGSDFTSKQLEQVSADLKMQLVFSTAGMPRGRGRIERFFQTMDQLFLHRLPGFIATDDGKPATKPALSPADFKAHFHDFLLDTYLRRPQKELGTDPKSRWEGSGFLPHMPESLEQLDLLLLTAAKTRVVRQDGIHFLKLRYLDTTLAAYIGEEVVIRYDPRDMAEIRVFHEGAFICRAFCQELTGQEVSLKEIVRARQARKRELRKTLDAHAQLLHQYVENQFDPAAEETVVPEQPKLKRYYNE